MVSTDCALARRGFERKSLPLTPRIGTRPVTLEAACARAAELLSGAQQALIGGLGTDMAGMRAALHLAECSNAILDHVHGDALSAQLQALQKQGWMGTTLTEIRNRADLLLLLGTDAYSHYPRFFERMVWNARALARARREPRVICIGAHRDHAAARSPSGRKARLLHCKQSALGEVAGALQAVTAQRTLQARQIAGISLRRLRALAAELQTAHYGVVLWEPAQLDAAAQPDLTIQAFCGLVEQLNRRTRYAGFALGGDNGGSTALNLCLWQSGYPLRVCYRDGTPQHDAWRYAAPGLIQRREIDLLLWISAFDGSLRPPRGMPRSGVIQLARPDTPPERGVQVYIPIGTPGIEHSGTLSRGDGIVALPLYGGLRAASHPSAAEVLGQIRRQLRRRRGQRS